MYLPLRRLEALLAGSSLTVRLLAACRIAPPAAASLALPAASLSAPAPPGRFVAFTIDFRTIGLAVPACSGCSGVGFTVPACSSCNNSQMKLWNVIFVMVTGLHFKYGLHKTVPGSPDSRGWIGPCIVLMDRPLLVHMSRRFSDFLMVSSFFK